MASWSDMIFGGDQMEALQVQSPVARPAPVERPGNSQPSRAMPTAPPSGVEQSQPFNDWRDDPAQQREWSDIYGQIQLYGRRAPIPKDDDVKAGPPALRKMLEGLKEQYGDPRASMAQPAPQTPQMAPRKWSDDVFSTPQPAPAAAAPGQKAVDPNAEPDAPWAWGKRLGQMVMGKQDPRYKDLESFNPDSEIDPQTGLLAKMVSTTDKQYADVIKKQLGDRFVSMTKDANGYDIVTYKGEDGKPQTKYINKPGIDLQDVDRTISNTVPYLFGGGVAGLLGKGVVKQVAAQGVAAGLVSTGSDVAAQRMGATDAPDLARAAIVGGFAGGAQAVAPVIGSLWRTYVTEPGLFDKAAGKLTEKGAEAARKAGFDPADIEGEIAKNFAQTMAKGGSADVAATDAFAKRFNLPITRGQVTKDAQQLFDEKLMRQGVYGEAAKDTITGIDKRQTQAISDATLGFGIPDNPGIGGSLAPSRNFVPSPQEIGQGISQGAKAARAGGAKAEKEAWKKVEDLVATPESLDMLPTVMSRKIAANEVDDQLTPFAARMTKELEGYVEGLKPAQGSKLFANSDAPPTVDQVRRRLDGIRKDAVTPGDKRVANKIYGAYNEWIDEAANASLLSGDAAAAASLRQARDVSREVKGIFQPRGQGEKLPEAAMLKKLVADGTTPENIGSIMFGAGTDGPIKAGTIQTLSNLKRGLQKYAPDTAERTWNDVRASYWLRTVQEPNGALRSPVQMAKAIETSMQRQKSVWDVLYTPEEMRTARQFVQALKSVSWKDPNPSGTASAGAQVMKNAGQAVLRSLMTYSNGMLGYILQGTLQAGPVKNVLGAPAAMRASKAAPLVPNLPSIGWMGGAPAARSNE